jgi:cytochrome c2
VTALAGLAATASAASTPEGQTIFVKYKCQSCHSIATAGLEKKKAAAEDAEEATAATADKTKKEPPDLSAVGVSHKASWMTAFLMKKEKTKEGKLHTKKFKGTDAELKKLTAWLETLKDAKAAEKATAKK